MTGDPEGAQQDPSVTRALALKLQEVVTLRRGYDNLADLSPAPDSSAAADERMPLGSIAWQLGALAWVVGSDHALSWYHLLLAGKQPMSGHYTLARGAIEGAVTCRWLLDRRVAPEQRRARAASAQLEDYRKRRAFEASIGAKVPEPPAKSGAERYKEHLAAMKKLGIPAAEIPTVTDLFRDYWQGDWLYRVLSAHAHGKQWALLTAARSAKREVESLAGTYTVLTTAGDELTLLAAIHAVDSLRGALNDYASYVGRAADLGNTS